MIAKDNRTPLYYQLMDIIVEQIETGNLQEHDKLPSERELCEIHDVSRTTVRQTMQELEKEGYIYKNMVKGVLSHLVYLIKVLSVFIVSQKK